jgi:hypothetical protein
LTNKPATEEMNCCHELKTDPHVFDAVVRGEKTYEIRFNDRDYKVGDNLFLRRTKFDGEGMKKFGAPLIYTGETITVKITHILQGQYGLQDGWAILSFIPAKALDASETVGVDPYLELEKMLDNVQGGQKALAEHFGISEQYMSDIRLHRRNFPDKIADKMGLRKVTYYKRDTGRLKGAGE